MRHGFLALFAAKKYFNVKITLNAAVTQQTAHARTQEFSSGGRCPGATDRKKVLTRFFFLNCFGWLVDVFNDASTLVGHKRQTVLG